MTTSEEGFGGGGAGGAPVVNGGAFKALTQWIDKAFKDHQEISKMQHQELLVSLEERFHMLASSGNGGGTRDGESIIADILDSSHPMSLPRKSPVTPAAFTPPASKSEQSDRLPQPTNATGVGFNLPAETRSLVGSDCADSTAFSVTGENGATVNGDPNGCAKEAPRRASLAESLCSEVPYTHRSGDHADPADQYDQVERMIHHMERRMQGTSLTNATGIEGFGSDLPTAKKFKKDNLHNGQDEHGMHSEIPTSPSAKGWMPHSKRLKNANTAAALSIKKDIKTLRGRSSTSLEGDDKKKSCKFLNRFFNHWLDPIIGALIVINTIIMFLQLEWEGRRTAVKYDFDPGPALLDDSDVAKVFEITEHIFAWVYLSELVMRLSFLGLEYFREKTNYLDIFVVAVNFADLYLLPTVAAGSGGDLAVVKVLRLARLARTVRFVRVLKIFSSLRVLVNTIARSIGSLIWSMVILGVFGLVGAMILCQASQEFINDKNSPYDSRAWVNAKYGTSTKAVWTMFELTMSGCWPNYASVLITDFHPAFAVFFALYVSVVVFAVIRIITALFLKDTLTVANTDADAVWQAKKKAKDEYKKRLIAFFEAGDEDGDGILTYEEFGAILDGTKGEKARAYLNALEIEVHEVKELFGLLDHKNKGAIKFADFADGVLRLKGAARSQDIAAIQKHVVGLSNDIKMLKGEFEDFLGVVAASRRNVQVLRGASTASSAALQRKASQQPAVAEGAGQQLPSLGIGSTGGAIVDLDTMVTTSVTLQI
eukprot:CAMPEP_0178403276 /NCGR_PEP_ID=MMETSP0689_2-20121128/17283_1 /TAXON_ID=160604 /ORGANISM="Amphidinium massartii, Strain CS-259" /LENGTH=767 /DNA_ID=CAMNT_0020024221 /DNA_START=31 /DNA_END=2334 /DNA_ORIENTATION=-